MTWQISCFALVDTNPAFSSWSRRSARQIGASSGQETTRTPAHQTSTWQSRIMPYLWNSTCVSCRWPSHTSHQVRDVMTHQCHWCLVWNSAWATATHITAEISHHWGWQCSDKSGFYVRAAVDCSWQVNEWDCWWESTKWHKLQPHSYRNQWNAGHITWQCVNASLEYWSSDQWCMCT